MFDWDIEPRQNKNPDCAPEFSAVKVVPGTGRFHTKGQAGHAASRASGNVVDEFDTRLANEIGAITRERDKEHGTRHKKAKAKTSGRIHRKARRTAVNGGES